MERQETVVCSFSVPIHDAYKGKLLNHLNAKNQYLEFCAFIQIGRIVLLNVTLKILTYLLNDPFSPSGVLY